jgi:RNA polymerase sigma-70 factor (ECF subfamily)
VEPQQPSLAELLEKCHSGDELAWETLVVSYQGRVYGLAYHYLSNSEDARDLAQTVFIRIYQSLHLCISAEMFLPWILRITRNACIDHIRRRNVRPPARDIPAEESPVVDQGATPEENSISESRKRLLHRALHALSLINREVLLLKEIQGLSLEETATTMGVPIGTIKSRLHRARIELAEKVLQMTSQHEAGAWTEDGLV